MTDTRPVSTAFLPLLAVLAVFFGASFPFARLGVGAGASPFALVVIDLGIAAGVMAIISALSRAPWPRLRALLTSTGVGALLIGGINLSLFWGVQYATGGAAAIVYATAPLVSVLAALAFGSQIGLSGRQSLALGLGLVGVIVLVLTTAGSDVLTNFWAVVGFGIGAVCQGTGAVLLSRIKPEGEGRWGLTFQFLGAGALATCVLLVLSPRVTVPWSPAVVESIVFVALGSLVTGYVIFYELVHRAGPVRANFVTYLNPIVALVIGVAAFHEPFQPFELAGLAIILVALGLMQRSERRPSRVPEGRASEAGASPSSGHQPVTDPPVIPAPARRRAHP